MQLRAMAVALGSNGHSGLLTQGDKGQGKRESCKFKIQL